LKINSGTFLPASRTRVSNLNLNKTFLLELQQTQHVKVESEYLLGICSHSGSTLDGFYLIASPPNGGRLGPKMTWALVILIDSMGKVFILGAFVI